MSLSVEKQTIIDRVQAALEYLPDDADLAAENQPWLALQFNQILDGLTHEDIHIFELMSGIALFGPAFSRVLRHRDPPEAARHPNLRVV